MSDFDSEDVVAFVRKMRDDLDCANHEIERLRAALAKREAVAGMYLLPTQATMDMQDTMRDALVDQGWCHDSASEVDFADIWYSGVNEYVTQQEDMLAASQQAAKPAAQQDDARDAEILRIADAMQSVAGPGAPYASASVPRYAVLGWVEQIRAILAAKGEV